MRSVGRLGTVLPVVALLAGCATDPVIVKDMSAMTTAGNWKIENAIDRVTGKPISSVMLFAKSEHSREAFKKNTVMQLGCMHGDAIAVFAFEVKVGAERNTEFTYRFDDKPGREAKVHIVRTYTTAAIEDQDDLRAFVNDMKTSRTLYILIRSLNTGRASAEFQLDGATEAIAAAFAGCPIKPPETPPQKKRRR